MKKSKTLYVWIIAAAAGIYLTQVAIGIGWGLPTSRNDAYLFPAGEPWTGEKMVAMAGGEGRTDAKTGADVDVNPLSTSDKPLLLNSEDAERVEIIRRYRLFTNQPDEMITMMSLSGMNPRKLQMDPKLYQYGGLFIYPVGALIGGCGSIGLFPVVGDLSYYLDHPDDFAMFYLVARCYVAAWGLVGLLVVWAIGRRLGGDLCGGLAALFYGILPVVVCMSHEAKPHLPGAVLMMLAVLFAMRWLDHGKRRDFVGLCVSCGAAFGMVLSSLPIFVLIPLACWLHPGKQTSIRRIAPFLKLCVGGAAIGIVTYLVTNPYIVINLVSNRDVLKSNFGNSLAMYEVSRLLEGMIRVLQLTIEGSTVAILILGIVALIVGIRFRRRKMWPLVVPAAVFAIQFVLIGAGKPDEYGRFGIFYESALAIGGAALLTAMVQRIRWQTICLTLLVLLGCVYHSAGYLWSFHADATGQGSRDLVAQAGILNLPCVAVDAVPAPYCCPPMDFVGTPIVLIDGPEQWKMMLERESPDALLATPSLLISARDKPEQWVPRLIGTLEHGVQVETYKSRAWYLLDSPISWANKPLTVVKLTDQQEPDHADMR